jgi:hypothetical protein
MNKQELFLATVVVLFRVCLAVLGQVLKIGMARRAVTRSVNSLTRVSRQRQESYVAKSNERRKMRHDKLQINEI